MRSAWLLVLSTLLFVPNAQPSQAQTALFEKEASFVHWSYFCDDICWLTTATTDLEVQVYVSFFSATNAEISVSYRDERDFPDPNITITVGCLTDDMLFEGAYAYPSTISINNLLLEEFLYSSTGTVQIGDQVRTFFLEGFSQGLEHHGHAIPPGSAGSCPRPVDIPLDTAPSS